MQKVYSAYIIKSEDIIRTKDNYNALVVGIGGTGTIRASMILGWSALQEGFKVRTAETHGRNVRVPAFAE